MAKTAGFGRSPSLGIRSSAMACLLLLLAVAFFACGRQPCTTQGSASSPGRVARQAAAPNIPKDARLDAFLGDWAESDGELVLSIKRSSNGAGVISLPPSDTWDSVLNNVRFEADTLRYDEYQYYKGKENFSTIANPLGDHPFSGVRMEITLSTGDFPDTLRERGVTRGMPGGVEVALHRYKGKAAVSGPQAGNRPAGSGR